MGSLTPDVRDSRSMPVVPRVVLCCVWFQIEAGYAGVIPDARGSGQTPVVLAWCCADVVHSWGWQPKERLGPAEQLVPADRFAREIGGFLTVRVTRSRQLNSTVGPFVAVT